MQQFPPFEMPGIFDTELVCRRTQAPAEMVQAHGSLQQVVCSRCDFMLSGESMRSMLSEQHDLFIEQVLQQVILLAQAQFEAMGVPPGNVRAQLHDPGGHFRVVSKSDSA